MSRSEAADHDDKRRKLLDQAARWFAEQGYDRASMSGLALACGVSKGLLYHYFSSKDEILAAIIFDHLQGLVDGLDALDEPAPEAWLLAASRTVLALYDGADHHHQLQLQAMHLLPDAQQAKLRELQRRMVETVAQRIADVPGAPNDEQALRALTMSLFAMLNWFYLWHRPERDMARGDYANFASRLIIDALQHARGESGFTTPSRSLAQPNTPFGTRS